MSIKVNIYNQKGEIVGDLELSPKVFGLKVNPALVHQAVVAQQANQRQVLAHTKDRGEVRGGGRKPWRQKGTGRARHGSIRSPIWRGGGVTFGPTKERNFKKELNKKMKQKAILMALSDKLASQNLMIVDKFELENYKTKIFNQIINSLVKIFTDQLAQTETADKSKASSKVKEKSKGKRDVLIVIEQKNEQLAASARNLADLKLISLDNINLVDLLKYQRLILTNETVKILEKRYNKDN